MLTDYFRIGRSCAITLNNDEAFDHNHCPVCRHGHAFASMTVNFDLISKFEENYRRYACTKSYHWKWKIKKAKGSLYVSHFTVYQSYLEFQLRKYRLRRFFWLRNSDSDSGVSKIKLEFRIRFFFKSQTSHSLLC